MPFMRWLPFVGWILLLLGRFEWSEAARPYSIRSYVLSVYLLLLLLPLVDGLFGKWAAGVVGFIYSFPYRWLGLDRYFYPLQLTDWRTQPLPKFETIWFPDAVRDLPDFPGQFFLLMTLFAIAVLLLRLLRNTGRLSPSEEKGGIALVVVILLQTLLHTSLRSPYTYIPHYEKPAESQYWYHYLLFPGAQGAVNLDYHAFRPGEELFIGVNRPVAALLSRAFPPFLVAPFVAFFNSYSVFYVFNVLFWMLGVLAIFSIARRVFGNIPAYFAACLMAMSQGMNLYVAQPKNYTIAIAGLALYLWFFIESGRKTFLLALATAIFLLCYEAHPWLVAIFFVGTYFGYDKRGLALSLGIGFLLYKGFLLTAQSLPHTQVGETLISFGKGPMENLKDLLLSGNIVQIGIAALKSLRGYLRCALHAFLPCVLFALWGFYLVRKERVRLLLFYFLLPGIITYTFFEMGSSFYTAFPRLVFSGYPAVYLGEAVALSSLWNWKGRWGKRLAVAILVVTFIYVNLDVWGYPSIYYIWFYRNFGFSLS